MGCCSGKIKPEATQPGKSGPAANGGDLDGPEAQRRRNSGGSGSFKRPSGSNGSAGAALQTIVFSMPSADDDGLDVRTPSPADAGAREEAEEVVRVIDHTAEAVVPKDTDKHPPERPSRDSEKQGSKKKREAASQRRQESKKKKEESKRRKESEKQRKHEEAEAAKQHRKEAKEAKNAGSVSITVSGSEEESAQAERLEKRGSRHLRLRGSDMSLDARIAASKASNGLLTAPDPNEDGDEEKWIYLSYDDEQLIENVHATAAGQNFSLYELQGIYAAFKENDMKLPRDYFNIVYCTFARINNPVMVDSIFDLFDRDHNGFVDYQEFIEFLAAMVRGDDHSRAMYFFNIYDRNHDGVLSREDIVSFMAKLPIEQILKHSASHAAERLPSLVEEDDEDEANEARLDEEHRAAIEAEEKAAEAARKKAEDERIRNELVSQYRSPSSTPATSPVKSPKGKGSPAIDVVDANPNLTKARELVDKCFEEMGYISSRITLQDFVAQIDSSPTLRLFLPF